MGKTFWFIRFENTGLGIDGKVKTLLTVTCAVFAFSQYTKLCHRFENQNFSHSVSLKQEQREGRKQGKKKKRRRQRRKLWSSIYNKLCLRFGLWLYDRHIVWLFVIRFHRFEEDDVGNWHWDITGTGCPTSPHALSHEYLGANGLRTEHTYGLLIKLPDSEYQKVCDKGGIEWGICLRDHHLMVDVTRKCSPGKQIK